MFKNLKIPVENNLDEIVAELEIKGYKILFNPYEVGNCIVKTVIAQDNGRIDFSSMVSNGDTTLAELKEM